MQVKRCSSCEAVKPLRDFNKSRENRDGYTYYCKDCNRAIKKESREKQIMVNRIRYENGAEVQGRKRCTSCGDLKSISEGFYRNAATKDGYTVYCKDCQYEKRMEKKKENYKPLQLELYQMNTVKKETRDVLGKAQVRYSMKTKALRTVVSQWFNVANIANEAKFVAFVFGPQDKEVN